MAQFWTKRFLNGRRRMDGDLEEGSGRTIKVNLEILSDVKNLDRFKSHCEMSVLATKNISRGGEILLS